MQQPAASLVAAYELAQPPVATVMPMKEAFVLKLEEAHSVGDEDCDENQRWSGGIVMWETQKERALHLTGRSWGSR